LHNPNFAARTEQWARSSPTIGRSIELPLPAFFTSNSPQRVSKGLRERGLFELGLYNVLYMCLLWICSHEARFIAGRNPTTINYARHRTANKATPNDSPKIESVSTCL
jgi:hypothetical protein